MHLMDAKKLIRFRSLTGLVLLFAAVVLLSIPAWGAPQVSSFIPSSIGQTAQGKVVAVYGSGFQCGMKVSFSNPAVTAASFNTVCPGGVTIIPPPNVQFVTTNTTTDSNISSNVFLQLTVPGFVPPGPLTLTFTNTDATQGTASLMVNPGPVITSVSTNPAAVFPGQTFTLILNGTGFQTGGGLISTSKGITINSLIVNGPGTLVEATVTVSPLASPMSVDITLVNPDGGSFQYDSAFSILWNFSVRAPALAVYEDNRAINGVDVPFDLFWNDNWLIEGNILPLPGGTSYTPNVMTLKPHPFLFQQVLGHSRSSNFMEYQVWNQAQSGSAIVNGWTAQQTVKNPAPNTAFGHQTFDMAYESNSGKGLLVYGTYSGLFYQRLYQDASTCGSLSIPTTAPCWGPAFKVSSSASFTGPYINRVRLVSNPDPASNEILLAYQDDCNSTPGCAKLYIRSWDGASFTSEVQVSNQTASMNGQIFDVNYTHTIKAGMLAWVNYNNGTPQYCFWSVGSCVQTAAGQAGSTATTNLYQVKLTADPAAASDQMALAALENTNPGKLTAQIWNGSAWGGVTTLSTSLNPRSLPNDYQNFDMAWVNLPQNILFAVYARQDGTGAGGALFQSWTSGGGWSPSNSIPGFPLDSGVGLFLPIFANLQLDDDPRTGDLLAIFKTYPGGYTTESKVGSSQLFTARWDSISSSWVDVIQHTNGKNNDFADDPAAISYFRNLPLIFLPTTVQNFTQGDAAVNLIVQGSLFKSGAVLGFPGFIPTGMTVNTTTVPNTLTATGSVDPKALPGIYDFTITNPDGSQVAGKNLIQIVPNPSNPPTVTSVIPNSSGDNVSGLKVLLTGYNFPANCSVSFSGSGITASGTVCSSSQISLTINIAAGASTGSGDIRDIIITDLAPPGTPYTSPSLFTVTPVPAITSVTPASIAQGKSGLNLTVTGSGFQPGSVLQIQDGANSLGWQTPGAKYDSYQNAMNGNLFQLSGTGNQVLYRILIKTNNLAPSPPGGKISFALYADNSVTPGTPGNLMGVVQTSSLLSGFGTTLIAPITPAIVFPPGKYWVLFNFSALGIVPAYDNGKASCDGMATSCVSVTADNPFGSWPASGGAPANWSYISGKQYAVEVDYYPQVTGLPFVAVGSATGGASVEGYDSNQMTGTSFSTSIPAHISGLTAFIESVDPSNPSGSMAIYADNGSGAPGALIVSSANQSLTANAFNQFPVSPTTLSPSPGVYWVMFNAGGATTALTYDDGTTYNSLKLARLFNTGWPSSGAGGWAPYPGRRYALGVLPDLRVIGSSDLSDTTLSALLSSDAGAVLGGRTICVINPDGGEGCTTIQVTSQPPASNALNTYGTSASSSPVYRYWDNVTPWGNEIQMAGGLASPAVWSVIRNFPNANLSGARPQEKVYLGSAGGLLAAQVWNGTTWALSFTVNASARNSRSFDAAYEQGSGHALAVYGIPGNGVPQYRTWNGTAPWSAAAPVSLASSTDSVFWVRLEPNPGSNPASNEILLAYLTGTVNPDGTVTNANLHLQFWNGTAFSADTINSAGAGNINLCQTCSVPVVGQLFDVAYEKLSGLPLAAWGITGVETPATIRWSGTTWSATALANAAASPAGTSLIYFKLASDPNSNRVALGTGSIDAKSYNVQIWDGSAWDAANKVNGNLVPGFVVSSNLLYSSAASDPYFDMGRNFDLAWEKNTGRLLTVFGTDAPVNYCAFSSSTSSPSVTPSDYFSYSTRYRIWDSLNGWSFDARVPPVGSDLVPRVIQLVSDLGSSDIYLNVAGHAANDFYAMSNDVTGPRCVLATNGSNSLSNPTFVNLHNYVWHNEGFNYKETMSATASGAFQATAGTTTYTAFGEPMAAGPAADTVPPSMITSLVPTAVTAGSVTLQWTASGDDGAAGRAASYIVAYSTTTISSDTDFNAAAKAPSMPATLPPFSTSLAYTETYTVSSGLNASTQYCFAVKAKDRAGNLSPLSSLNPCVTTNVYGTNTPGPVTDLQIVPGTLFTDPISGVISVELAWTAPLIPGFSPTSTPPSGEYDFRYSASPITDDVSFNNAIPYLMPDGTGKNGMSLPHTQGTLELLNFVGLPAGNTYFAIKSCGPAAVDTSTFRCSAALGPQSPLAISQINTNSPPVFVSTGSANSTPPSTITDLMVTGSSSNSITLRWTAPGDSGNTGTAASYDIRYATTPIVPSNSATFYAATRVLNPPAPLSAGTVQSFAVTNLVSGSTVGTTFYFAIQTYGTGGLPSSISNVSVGTTLPVNDISPPAAITDLKVVPDAVRSQSVVLTWTATGDNGTAGKATRYDLRYSPFQIMEDGMPITDSQRQVSFSNAAQVSGVPLPSASGSLEMFTVPGLVSDTLYNFAIKAIDGAGNQSPLSTCLNCPGHTALYAGYNLVSVPYNIPSGSNDPTTVFGNDVTRPVTVYEWLNQAYTPPLTIAEANGYFLYARGDFAVLKASDAFGTALGSIETALSVTVPLQFGWNMIGEPYLTHPVYLQNVCVKKGNAFSVSFATAVTNGWINASIYSYNGSQYLAERYVDPLGINPPALMTPWKGYWFQVLASDAIYSLVYLDKYPGSCP